MEKTFETPGGVRLSVEIHAGLVVVTAGAADRTVVSLEADTPGAEELVRRATVECRPAGERHLVEVKLPHVYGMRLLRRNAVTVRVEVPEGAQVAVATASADVEINGPVGEVDFKTASGNASIDDVAADVTAKTASGNITIGKVGGDIRAHTVSGDLRCSSVAGAAFFSATSGDLELGAAGSRVEVKATSGDVRLGELAARRPGHERLGERTRPRPGRGHAAGALRVGRRGGRRGQGRRPSRRRGDGVGHRALRHSARRRAAAGARPEARVDLSVRSVSGNVEIGRALEHVA